MLSYTIISDWKQMNCQTSVSEIVDFLYLHLDRYRDNKEAIAKSIHYALTKGKDKGGYIILARLDNELAGVVVVNRTGMSEYIPEYILVYIAIRNTLRGKGYGTELMRHVIGMLNSPVALHVEYNNPARHLYERIGFTTKYAEMRYNPRESYHDYP